MIQRPIFYRKWDDSSEMKTDALMNHEGIKDLKID